MDETVAAAQAGDTTWLATFDLRALPPAFYENPYPFYHALRQHDPVRRMPDQTYFLTRHADVVAVYRDARRFSSDKKAEFRPKFGASPLYEHHTTSLVFNDPPLHTNVRRLIAGALSARVIAEMEPGIEHLVATLLDRAAERGNIDLIEDFAALIPVEVIGNLLAVPHEERGPLRGWSLAILGALEPAPDAAMLARGNRAVEEFLAYLRDPIAARRRLPGDPARDILTRLIAGEADGSRLTEKELLHNCIFLLNAGHETTTNLIGNALHALITFPAERARLLADPTLMASAIEEFLRFESSNQLGNRRALAACEIGGITIPEGALITLGIGAANRDPAQFPDPDRLDLARTPNRHIAFGFGIHQCAGLTVARLEARIAIGRFLERFPRYDLAAPPVRGGRARFRGFLSLPVTLT
ncbi:cytochrome P450 [Acidibrevibacterium fodinaquatile]|uniref:cytochrome P450 n=1 Tax=Acidibrevibacterium fodinaquatile TaxID=1969806 RepID=UPI00196329C5|nr:cytochrome P450 [Acidibrevibacterium fodinaquatile]